MINPVFISHGAPDLVLSDNRAKAFLSTLGDAVGRPEAILVVSAHWETAAPAVSLAGAPRTIHDFGGFPDALYEIVYPAPGAPDIAHDAALLLEAAGLDVRRDSSRGLDHGAWIPLMLMYPDADIPVFQLSVQPHAGARHAYQVGQALRSLSDRGVLVLGSGSYTHDLGSYIPNRHNPAAAEPSWVTEFADWMTGKLDEGDIEALLDYRASAPNAVQNHPTEEHILPLFTALGAGQEPGWARNLHVSTMHGVLRMDAFAFGRSA